MSRIRSSLKITYSCNVCGKEYSSAEEARKYCETYTTEKSRFTTGTVVCGLEQLICHCDGGFYFPVGKITKIVGPVVGNLTTSDGKRNVEQWGHVYLYEVEYDCPYCLERKDSVQFWTSELTLVSPISEWQVKSAI